MSLYHINSLESTAISNQLRSNNLTHTQTTNNNHAQNMWNQVSFQQRFRLQQNSNNDSEEFKQPMDRSIRRLLVLNVHKVEKE